MGDDKKIYDKKIYDSMDKLLYDIKNTLDIVLKEVLRKKSHLEYLDKRIEMENNNNLQLKKVLSYYNNINSNKTEK